MQWRDLIGQEKQKPYFQELMAFVDLERSQGKTIYPKSEDVFNAFKYTSVENLKVVILGQDPYHGPNQAHGLSFSVLKGNPVPPSLRNIYKELASDIEGFELPGHGELTHWAQQGVLLLNTVMTVQKGVANSHRNKGWEMFTDVVINQISEQLHDIVFLLWGSPAQKKVKLINTSAHHILTAPHPSPLSAHRGFLGCRHFSQTNQILSSVDKTPIDWQLPIIE